MNFFLNWVWSTRIFSAVSRNTVLATALEKRQTSVGIVLVAAIWLNWILFCNVNLWFGKQIMRQFTEFEFLLNLNFWIWVSLYVYNYFDKLLEFSAAPKNPLNLNWVKNHVKQFFWTQRKFGTRTTRACGKRLKTAKNSQPIIKSWKETIKKKCCSDFTLNRLNSKRTLFGKYL